MQFRFLFKIIQKKIHIFITLCLIHSALSFSQHLNRDSLIGVLKSSKCVEGKHIGITHVKSYVYMAAEALWEQCTVKELVKLCAHKNEKVRCYAFLGLIYCLDERKIAEQVADKHLSDSVRVVKWDGCIQWPCTVSEFMEMKLRDYYSGDKGYRRLK